MRHMEHGQQTREQRECACHVNQCKVLGLLYLVLNVLRGALQLLLQRVDLALLAGQLEGEGLGLDEQEGRGDGQQRDGSVVEDAVDAACGRSGGFLG